jgi:antitoxin ParD1/3/4
MATMNVSLPELRVRVDALVQAGDYQTNSDYVRDVIRRDLEEREEGLRIQRLLDEGRRSPARVYDAKALAALEEELIAGVQPSGK